MRNNIIALFFNNILFYLLMKIFLTFYYSELNFYCKIIFFICACYIFLNLDKKNIDLGFIGIVNHNVFLKFKWFNRYILSKHELYSVGFFRKNNSMKYEGLSKYNRKYFYLYNTVYVKQCVKNLIFLGFSNNNSIIYYWNLLLESDFIEYFLYIKSKMSVV